MKIYPRLEWLRVGLLLAFGGGMLDAYTFLWRGEVLATAETGNIVMMGLNLVRGQWGTAISYILPITAFALGVFAAEIIRFRMEGRGICPQWRRYILFVEMVIIGLVTFLPLGSGDAITNIAISFVSALQVESFRHFRGCPAFTTMCTGNLRSGSDSLSRWLLHHDDSAKEKTVVYFSIITAFFCGVLACDLLSLVTKQYTVLLALIPLAVVYWLIQGECELPKPQ